MDEAVSLLSPDLAAMPVKELNRSTKNMLAQFLDPPHAGYNKDGVMQDWTGLAELMNLDPQEIEFYETNQNANESKTMGILKKWSFSSGTSTLGKLWDFIEQLERYDILNDNRLLSRFNRDFEAYKERKEIQKEEDRRYREELDEHIRPVQVPQIDSNHQDLIEYKDRTHDQYRHIVVDDVLYPDKPQVIYDAFVSFCHSDFAFVQEMLDMVETKHGLRLCVNARDLLPGASSHFVTAKLIADRCRKVVLIMSPDFVNSPECEFQVKIALTLSPGAKQKILIPIVYRPCKIPLVLQHVCTVDYTKIDLADWFWTRLSASLRESHVSVTRHLTFDESVKLQRVEMELLPEGDDNPTHILQSSYSGKIRPPKVVPQFKGQPHRSDRERKPVTKQAACENKSVESSMEYEKSGFEFVSGEYREQNLGSIPPEIAARPTPPTNPGLPCDPPRESPPIVYQQSHSRFGKTSPRPPVRGTISHPSFSAQNLPNSTPNFRQNAPNLYNGSKKISSGNMSSHLTQERNALVSNIKSNNTHSPGLKEPISKLDPQKNTSQRDQKSKSRIQGNRDGNSSVESSMECERGSIDPAALSRKGNEFNVPLPDPTGSFQSNYDRGCSGDNQEVRYPPMYRQKKGDNERFSTNKQGSSVASDEDDDTEQYRYGGQVSLYSLPSTDIKLPPMELKHESQQQHASQSSYKSADQSKRISSEYDHEQHALASLSMSTIEFHYRDKNTGAGPSPADNSEPLHIDLPPPTLQGSVEDNNMSIDSDSVRTIRGFFPSTNSNVGCGQQKYRRN